MKRIARRHALVVLGTLGILAQLAYSQEALAGSYLYRAAVLLKGAALEANALRVRSFDKELAKVCHNLALARAEASREMSVPSEVQRAHPHLLLVMESYERVAAAALRGDQQNALASIERARNEAAIFVAVLKENGWALPSV